MAPDNAMVLLELLGKELARRGLTAQVETARKSWVALKKGETPPWELPQVIAWMGLLKVPPYESLYSLEATNSRCPRCAQAKKPRGQGGSDAELVLPDRRLMRCRSCRAPWIEMVG